MSKSFVRTLGLALVSIATASPALAVNLPPVHVPEPTTMSILAVSVAGAAIARHLFRRK